MATIVTPPSSIANNNFKIFLAGAIDMGDAVDWQSQVIEKLANLHNLTLLNPRRKDFTPEKLDEQIVWELNALELADIIFMWFPGNSEAPISLLEAGLYMRSGKLVLGAEINYYRRRNLELTAEFYDIPIWSNLADLVSEVSRRYTLAR